MSNENNRKRDRDAMEYNEATEEYVGIISADSTGEPLNSFTISQFRRDIRTMRQNQTQNVSNILDNKIYENSMMTVD
jgi:hypothetical protein